MELEKEQIEWLEQEHNVYIHPNCKTYHLNGYDEIFGWRPIPKEWIENAHFDEPHFAD